MIQWQKSQIQMSNHVIFGKVSSALCLDHSQFFRHFADKPKKKTKTKHPAGKSDLLQMRADYICTQETLLTSGSVK